MTLILNSGLEAGLLIKTASDLSTIGHFRCATRKHTAMTKRDVDPDTITIIITYIVKLSTEDVFDVGISVGANVGGFWMVMPLAEVFDTTAFLVAVAFKCAEAVESLE